MIGTVLKLFSRTGGDLHHTPSANFSNADTEMKASDRKNPMHAPSPPGEKRIGDVIATSIRIVKIFGATNEI